MRALMLAAAMVAGLLTATGATVRAAPASPVAPASAQFEAKVADAKQAMMSDPSQALIHARAVIVAAKALPQGGAAASATGQWLEGEALMRLNRQSEAKPVLNAALATAQRVKPGSKLHADLMKARAVLSIEAGEFQAGLTALQKAHRMFGQLGERRSQAIVLQTIGSIYLEARDYPKVLEYYDQANEVFSDDPSLRLSACSSARRPPTCRSFC